MQAEVVPEKRLENLCDTGFMTFYGLVIAAAAALLLALRYGRGWTEQWRRWMYGERRGATATRTNSTIT